jgi:hypothetical protein
VSEGLVQKSKGPSDVLDKAWVASFFDPLELDVLSL